MNRIDRTLEKAQARHTPVLSPYLTAGDPSVGDTVRLMHALVKAGADILELGIPFSDPMAEGPVIQAAMERALAAGVTVDTVFRMVADFRRKDRDTPVVLMGYVNPVEQYGYQAFAERAVEVGVDGTILVDMPPEESEELVAVWDAANLYPIYLCSPTTSPARMKRINRCARGYLYFVSIKGVTGSDALDPETVSATWRVRKSQTTLPLLAGFGIKTPEVAARVGAFADGVVVGAALVDCLDAASAAGQDPIAAGAALMGDMRNAMNEHGK